MKIRKSKNTKRIANVVCSIGLFLSLLIGGVGGCIVFLYLKMDKINYKPLDYSIVSPTGTTEDLLTKNTVLNVCFFGLDRRDKSDTKSRSDSTMLLSINSSLKKIKEVSFMRDIYTTIPGYGKNRLNSAISCGQESLAIKTLQNTFGVKIDKYVTVDFENFKEIINILGGIKISLSAKEAAYINGDLWYYKSKSSPLPVKDGVYLLDGDKALSYSRARKIPTPEGLHDDFARTYRQRTVIVAIFKKISTLGLKDLLNIIDKLGPCIKTNFAKGEIIALAKNMTKYSAYKIEQFRLPTDDNVYSENINGMAVLTIPNLKKARFDLAKFLYEDDLKIKEKAKNSYT